MATVTKDFRIKSGLVVEGANGTINGSDIITANTLTTGTESGISVSYDSGTKTVTFDVNDPTITISGDVDGSATMTDLGNTEIAVTLDTVNSNVGTFGSTTQIPSITVDGKGRVTAVITNDVATNLSIAANTGTDTVDLLNDTLTFTGGDGISTTVSNNDVLIAPNIGNGLTIDGADIAIDTSVTVDVNSAQTLSNKTLGSNLNADNFKVINLANPEGPQEAATKAYVDSVAQGLDVKESVRVATTENISNISTSGPTIGGSAVLAIDGVSLAYGDRVLVKNQSNAAENGIYVAVENPGSSNFLFGRAADANEPDELNAGTFVFVEEGTTYGDTGWVVSSDNPLVIGTDPMSWTQFSGAGTYLAGTGLTLTGNTFSIDDAVVVTETDLNTAVTNLTNYVDGFLDPSTGTTVEYIDQQDAATLVAANAFTTALVETGDPTATPTYLALDINSVSKQIALQATLSDGGENIVTLFDKNDYRSAKLLVKVAFGTHTEVSEVMLTLDTADNVAITEYAVVGTNGSMSQISAEVVSNSVNLLITPTTAGSVATIMGTLLV